MNLTFNNNKIYANFILIQQNCTNVAIFGEVDEPGENLYGPHGPENVKNPRICTLEEICV